MFCRPKLKLRIREKVLDVSDLALSVGDGGVSSGREMSGIGGFQKLKSVNSGALVWLIGGNI